MHSVIIKIQDVAPKRTLRHHVWLPYQQLQNTNRYADNINHQVIVAGVFDTRPKKI